MEQKNYLIQYIKDIQTYNLFLQKKNYQLKKNNQILNSNLQLYKNELQIYSKQENYIRNILQKKYKENIKLKNIINQHL